MKFGSPLASPSVQFSPGQVDNFGSFTPSGGSRTTTFTVFAQNSYNAIAILVAGTVSNNALCAQVQNNTFAASPLGPQSTGVFNTFITSGAAQEVILPVWCKAGDGLTVTIYWNSTNFTSVQVQIYGLTQAFPVPIRSDGRLHPLGRFVTVSGSLTGSLVGAPASPFRIYIRSLMVAGTGYGGLNLQGIQGTINGSTVPLCMIAYGTAGGTGAGNAGDSKTVDYPEGLLLDTATALSLQQNLTGSFTAQLNQATAIYDYIV